MVVATFLFAAMGLCAKFASIWMGLFLIGGAAMLGSARIDGRLIATVLVGFAGVALILRPTIEHDQLWHGLMGLLSGVLAAMAYLQVDALGRAGEPEERTVFYFCVGGLVVGALAMGFAGTQPHTLKGIGLLLAIGVLASVTQLMMTRAFVGGRILVNASLQYLGIVYAYVFGMLFFDDRMTWSAVLGMALVVGAGVAATLLRSSSRPADNAATATMS